MTSPTATAEIERLVDAFDVAAQNLGAADYAVHAGLIASAEPKHARTKAALLAALRAAEAERDRMRKEVVVLKAAMAWTDEVYPETTEARGARVDMTWVEFNRMREAIGLPPRKVRGRAALQSTSAKEGE